MFPKELYPTSVSLVFDEYQTCYGDHIIPLLILVLIWNIKHIGPPVYNCVGLIHFNDLIITSYISRKLKYKEHKVCMFGFNRQQ